MAMPVNAGSSVRSVQRALDLLFRLAEHPDGVSLQRLADEVGFSKSTTHRLLATLERAGAAEQDLASRAYRLGPRLRRLAPPGDRLADLRRIALPYMVEVRDVCGESIALQVLDDCWTVVLEQCESPHEVRRGRGRGEPPPGLTRATRTATPSRLAPP